MSARSYDIILPTLVYGFSYLLLSVYKKACAELEVPDSGAPKPLSGPTSPYFTVGLGHEHGVFPRMEWVAHWENLSPCFVGANLVNC